MRDSSGNAMATGYVWRLDAERHSAFLPVVVEKGGQTGVNPGGALPTAGAGGGAGAGGVGGYAGEHRRKQPVREWWIRSGRGGNGTLGREKRLSPRRQGAKAGLEEGRFCWGRPA